MNSKKAFDWVPIQKTSVKLNVPDNYINNFIDN